MCNRQAMSVPHVAADRACSSGQVFNNDSLPERGFHAVGQDAAQRVGRAACRKRYNNGNRACGKRLGPREAGGERDAGRAGGQAQNIAAWKCHAIASPNCAKRQTASQNRLDHLPAEGSLAAVALFRNAGLFRWQL